MRTETIDDVMCHALYTAAQSTVQLYRDLLAPWGLTFQQLLVLGVLWKNSTMTPGEIGEALRLDSSSVAGLLRRMQDSELIERTTDRSDRRRVCVTATEHSLSIRDELGWLEECVARALGFEKADAMELIARLHTLRASIDAFPREPHPAGLTRMPASP